MNFNNASSKTKRRKLSPLVASVSSSGLLLLKALALILDCGLSKDSYQHIRLDAVEAGCKLYPPYNAVREPKEQYMPNIRGSLSETDYSASVNLQNLLEHTTACLVNLQKDQLLQKHNIKKFT